MKKIMPILLIIVLSLTGCSKNNDQEYTNTIMYDSTNEIYLKADYFVNDLNQLVGGSMEFVNEDGVVVKGSYDAMNNSLEQYNNIIHQTAKFPTKDQVAGNPLDYELVKECYDGAEIPTGTIAFTK